LIELVLVILIIGILSGIAVQKMMPSLETSRIENTKTQLDALAAAIAGNPEIYASGARADFGYVGDIGALPGNLDDLASNPGYSTWDGPYISGSFASADYKKDGWGTVITYSGTTITSTGSGSNIDKQFALSSASLLTNNVSGVVVDANRNLPGVTYRDSLEVNLIYPNGSGSYTTSTTNPNRSGYFSFSSVPVGNHTLRVIYIPDNDTLSYSVTVNPSRDATLDITFAADLW